MAASLLDNPKLSLNELTAESLMDVISQIADGSDPLNQKIEAVYETSKKLIEDCGDDTLTNRPLGAEPDPNAEKADCPTPSLPIQESMPSQGLAVSYLLKFYNNIHLFERENKCSEPPLSDLLQNLRSILVNHLVLVLLGNFGLEKCRKSPLLPYILIGNTPLGLTPELLQASYHNNEKQIFQEVRNLF